MRDETTPVLIVGGGPAGLAASLLLTWLGTASVLVERHPGTSVHPRAWGWYPRTLELFRPSGVSDAMLVAAEGFRDHDLNGKVESLAGREVAISRIPAAEDVSDVSPIPRIVSLPQDRMEPIVRRRCEELGADLRFGTELTGLAQDDEGVTATVRDAAGQRTIRARYVIAADGSRGGVADRLGVTRTGRGTLRHQISILFHADLAPALRGRRFAVCQVENDRVDGVLGHDDTLTQGTLIVTYHPDKGEDAADFTPERCVRLVRAAVGDPALDVRLRGVLPWELAALTATRFTAGRVFLAGDAAHVMPPVGGFGANTAVHDAHNLAWKLHYVLSGCAAPGLLDTYDLERRPVAAATAAQAGLRLAVRAGFARPEEAAAMADTLAVTTGYRYTSPAILPAEETPPNGSGAGGGMFEHPRWLAAQPGTRVPHLPVPRSGGSVSVLDLVGRNLVLLGGPGAGEWCARAGEAARRLRVPLDVHRLGTAWPRAYGLGDGDVLAVRPDGFVAWRSTASRTPSSALFEHVLATMMGRRNGGAR